jgi:hypothetical protein
MAAALASMDTDLCSAAMGASLPSLHRCARAAILAPLLTLALTAGAARAGSSTAESTWDRNAAQQRAMEGVPKGATVTRTMCEDIGMSGNNDRYRCTVFFDTAPAATPPAAAPAGSP